jgi:hypothetical protein
VQKNNNASTRRQLLPPKLNERNEKKRRSCWLSARSVKQNVQPLWRKLVYSSNAKRKQKHVDKHAKRQKRLLHENLSLHHQPSVQMAEILLGGEIPQQTRSLPPPLALRMRLSPRSGLRAPVPPQYLNTGQELFPVVGGQGRMLKPRTRQPPCRLELREPHPLALAHPHFLRRKNPNQTTVFRL